eukprot:g2544.t1
MSESISTEHGPATPGPLISQMIMVNGGEPLYLHATITPAPEKPRYMPVPKHAQAAKVLGGLAGAEGGLFFFHSGGDCGVLTAATGSTIGNLTLADGSITDSSSATSFGGGDLSTTGTLPAATGSTIGNLTLADGSITDSSGTTSFGDGNLSTTGTLPAATGSTIVGNLTLADGSITGSSGATAKEQQETIDQQKSDIAELKAAVAALQQQRGA